MIIILLYFVMGLVFTYYAYFNAAETAFNIITISFLLIATFDFYIAFRGLKAFMNRKKE